MPLSHTSVTVCDKVLLPVTVVIARTGRLIRRKCQLMLAFAWCKGQHQLTREGNPFADEGRMKSDLRLVWCLCRDIFCHFGKRAPALHFVHHRHSDLSSCFGFLFRYKKVKKKSSWCNPMFNMHFCARDTKNITERPTALPLPTPCWFRIDVAIW